MDSFQDAAKTYFSSKYIEIRSSNSIRTSVFHDPIAKMTPITSIHKVSMVPAQSVTSLGS